MDFRPEWSETVSGSRITFVTSISELLASLTACLSMFRGKKLWISGDYDLTNTPTDRCQRSELK